MSLSPGARLGPYEIVSPLGAGGMGEVYRARDERLKRDVAVKVLPASFASDPDRLRRFEHEAQAAGLLNHPNITAVYDIGSVDGAPYVVSELLEGETLRAALVGGRLSARKAIDYAIQLAQGLAAAHEKGIVHRDVKPENLFLTKDGRLKILDFGLAKLTHSDRVSEPGAGATIGPTETESGAVMGTVGYMSPEQLRGKRVDYRSDIFAFGAILYELLSGRRAFHGDSVPETMNAILKDDPPELSESGRSISPALARVVSHCLEKIPERRFHSLYDVVFALQEVEQPSSPSAVPPAPGKARGSRLVRGITRWIGLSAAAVAVLAILAVLLGRLGRQTRTGPPTSPSSSSGQLPRIVVLPFDNLGSPEDAYFARGMTQEITSRLGNVRRLGVISRTTATEYSRKGKTIKQLGADLGVDWVLEGTIRCDRSAGSPGRIRITPELIRVADDTHVWSERYDRRLTDIFSLQSDVATKTVEAIGISLAPSEKSSLETIPTKDLVAYDHYLKGLAAGERTIERSDIEVALWHFQEAVNRAPSFVAALAHLSLSHLQMYWYFYDRSEKRLEKGRSAAEAAARLGPDLPESHDALGFLYYWGSRDYARATEEFQTARRIRPNDGLATTGLAAVARRLGRWEESAALYAEAANLDPRNTSLLGDLALTLTMSRRYREADDLWATCIYTSPGTGWPRAHRIWLQVQWRGDVGRAKTLLAEAEQVPDLRDDMSLLDSVAYQLSLADRDFAGALRRLDADSRKAYSSQGELLPLDLLRSEIYGLTGRTDECRRSAEKARIFLEAEIGKRPNEPQLHGALGIALALLGRKDDALRAARRGVGLMPTSKDAFYGLLPIESLAVVCTLVGRQDEAIEQFGVLLSSSGYWTPHVLRLDPRLDALRNNPKFEALLTKYEVRS